MKPDPHKQKKNTAYKKKHDIPSEKRPAQNKAGDNVSGGQSEGVLEERRERPRGRQGRYAVEGGRWGWSRSAKGNCFDFLKDWFSNEIFNGFRLKILRLKILRQLSYQFVKQNPLIQIFD